MEDLMGNNVAQNEVVISNEDYDAAVQQAIEFAKPRVPEGEHVLKVESYSHGVSGRGNKQIIWIVSVLDGDPTSGLGTSFKHWTVLTNSGIYNFLNALGINKTLTPDVFQPDGIHLSNDLVVGRMFKARLVHDQKLKPESEGKPVDELNDLDYYWNLQIKSAWQYDEVGKKHTGELGVVTSSQTDAAPFM